MYLCPANELMSSYGYKSWANRFTASYSIRRQDRYHVINQYQSPQSVYIVVMELRQNYVWFSKIQVKLSTCQASISKRSCWKIRRNFYWNIIISGCFGVTDTYLGDRVSLRFVLSGWKKGSCLTWKWLWNLKAINMLNWLLPSLILKCLSAAGNVSWASFPERFVFVFCLG